ncbi:MAG: MFS transporter, partial [Hyphomicrobiales bacterium]|nr:MFS transporter [Hyphomicrobiales bacterium]
SGRIAYITCSLLPEENEARITAFLQSRPGWRIRPREHLLAGLFPELAPLAAFGARQQDGLLLTPERCGTDGFFLAMLERVE